MEILHALVHNLPTVLWRALFQFPSNLFTYGLLLVALGIGAGIRIEIIARNKTARNSQAAIVQNGRWMLGFFLTGIAVAAVGWYLQNHS